MARMIFITSFFHGYFWDTLMDMSEWVTAHQHIKGHSVPGHGRHLHGARCLETACMLVMRDTTATKEY